MNIETSDRLELLKLEMQLLQQRLTKYDELIWTVRSWAVTLTVALTSWASTKLDNLATVAWILRIAIVVPALFWIEEGLLRAGYVARYIDRYRLLRSALNDSASDLEKVPLYDLTGHRAGRTPRLHRFLHSFFRWESIFLYLALASVPLLFTLLADKPASGRAKTTGTSVAKEIFSPQSLTNIVPASPKKPRPSGGSNNFVVGHLIVARANQVWRHF